MIYGYCRVSTTGQARDGNSLEAQENLLRANGAEKIYADTCTGTRTKRPEFDKLISELKSGDTLVVTKLDRFARSLIKGTELVKELLDRDIKVHILNMGYLDNTPASKLTRNIFFSFAEYERDMICERTAEGKFIARQDPSYREGRPKVYGREQIQLAMELLDQGNSYTKVERMTGISKSTLTRARRKYRADKNEM